MKNLEIRMMVSENGLRYKDVAKEIGISREWLSRLLKDEMTPENKDRVIRAVLKLKLMKENR